MGNAMRHAVADKVLGRDAGAVPPVSKAFDPEGAAEKCRAKAEQLRAKAEKAQEKSEKIQDKIDDLDDDENVPALLEDPESLSEEADMYNEDADDLDKIADALDNGDISKAAELLDSLDTAAADEVDGVYEKISVYVEKQNEALEIAQGALAFLSDNSGGWGAYDETVREHLEAAWDSLKEAIVAAKDVGAYD